MGVGGVGVSKVLKTNIDVLISDGTSKIEKRILPVECFYKTAPSITSEIIHKIRESPIMSSRIYNEGIVDFVSPKSERKDRKIVINPPIDNFDLETIVREELSPEEKEDIEEYKREQELCVDYGEERPYILLGRDFQSQLDILLLKNKMYLAERGELVGRFKKFLKV